MSKKLEDQNYYHGIRTRNDIEKELKKPGDFLVRAAQSKDRFDIVLNVLGDKGVCNILLSVVDEGAAKYCLHSQKTAENRLEFGSVVDLINFFRVVPLPGGSLLKRSVPRPKWLIKHSAIKYDPTTDKLGSGNYCDVYKGILTQDNTQQSLTVAIKACQQESAPSNSQAAYEARVSMMAEAKLMQGYSHHNVIGFLGVACDHPPILLVMEFCPGGSLEELLQNHSNITNMELILYCLEVARGMRYLHFQKCVHRDLATRNCLISEAGVIKIADFGLSKIINELQQNGEKLKNVPIRWMAPECLTRTPIYSLASDIWAYGVLIFEVFNRGVPPWPDDTNFKEMAKRIRAYNMPSLPKSTPQIIRKLVEERIWRDADSRILFKEILVILTDFVFDNIELFPKADYLVVNKIKGVQRKHILMATKQEILADEKERKKTHSTNSRVRRKRHRSRQAKSAASRTNLSARNQTLSIENLQQQSTMPRTDSRR